MFGEEETLKQLQKRRKRGRLRERWQQLQEKKQGSGKGQVGEGGVEVGGN